eukprot:gene35959-46702_t
MSTMQQQQESLTALYQATGGGGIGDRHWSRADNWDQTQEEGIQPYPVSSFYGVTVDGSGAVVRLDLANNGLSGDIPSHIRNLTSLTELDMSSNSLTGSIPEQVGDLRLLTKLNMGSNKLSGAIPAGIGNLTLLSELYLGSTLVPEFTMENIMQGNFPQKRIQAENNIT